MYQIVVGKRVYKDLDDIPAIDVEKLNEAIRNLADNPRPNHCKKLVTKINYYRIRQRNYRIVYEILDKQKIVNILGVGHRKDIYRKFV